MTPRDLFDRLVGSRPNWRWAAWLAALWITLAAVRDCWGECTAASLSWNLGWNVIGLITLAVLFFTFNGGVPLLRTKLAVGRLRSTLDPIAKALGATVSTRWSDNGDPVCSVFFTFSDHFYVVVLVGPRGGFNPYRHADEVRGGPAPKELNILHAAAVRACG